MRKKTTPWKNPIIVFIFVVIGNFAINIPLGVMGILAGPLLTGVIVAIIARSAPYRVSIKILTLIFGLVGVVLANHIVGHIEYHWIDYSMDGFKGIMLWVVGALYIVGLIASLTITRTEKIKQKGAT